MSKNHHLAKSITDASWGKFFELLSYKAEEAGRKVIKVPRFEPTSKTCSACGVVNQELELSDRQWVCKSCGTLHDRDYNAAKNILRVGQTLQELTYGNTQSVS
jgi:putative transposase